MAEVPEGWIEAKTNWSFELGTTMEEVVVVFNALLMIAAVASVPTPQAAARAPHQLQLGVDQPPYQPWFQRRTTPQPGPAQPGRTFTLLMLPRWSQLWSTLAFQSMVRLTLRFIFWFRSWLSPRLPELGRSIEGPAPPILTLLLQPPHGLETPQLRLPPPPPRTVSSDDGPDEGNETNSRADLLRPVGAEHLTAFGWRCL